MKTFKTVLFALLLALASTGFAASSVNINTADAATLSSQLNGIGPAKAEAIVAYRKEHGPFKSVDQLVDVKGIGLKTIEKNRDNMSVGGAAAPAKAVAKNQ